MNCKYCGEELIKTDPHQNNRSFCNANHRNKFYWKNGGKERNRVLIDKKHLTPSDEKIQCLICGKWYRQVGSHIFSRHKMTAREYREEFKLEVKRGLTKGWYRQLKGEQAILCGGVENLVKGEQFRLKKGQTIPYVRSQITIDRLRQMQKQSPSGQKHLKKL